MAIIGGNLETKEIGLPFGLSGTHRNTQVDAVTGFLKLAEVDRDSLGNPIHAEEGYWESDVIDFAEKFADYDKVFITSTNMGADSYAIQTRVSDDSVSWSDWTPIALDGTIQSETKRYIQVKIILYAGFVNDVFIVNKNEYTENNKYVENILIKESASAIPTLTSNTSSNEGFAFAKSVYSSTYPAWKAFDKITNSGHYLSATSDRLNGFIGFSFYNAKIITKYKITASSTTGDTVPKDFYLEASNDTTTGLDGTWVILDEQTNQTSWKTLETREFDISNTKRYKSYRIRWYSNNGHGSYTGLGELDFYEDEITHLKLKREYELDMTLDTTWSEEGSLHRQKIARDEWLRIDKMNVLQKD